MPFTRVNGVLSGMWLDDARRWLYYSNTGSGQLRRVDISSGEEIPLVNNWLSWCVGPAWVPGRRERVRHDSLGLHDCAIAVAGCGADAPVEPTCWYTVHVLTLSAPASIHLPQVQQGPER